MHEPLVIIQTILIHFLVKLILTHTTSKRGGRGTDENCFRKIERSSIPLFRPVEYLDFSRLLSNTFHTHSDFHELFSTHTIFVLTGSLRTYMFGRSDSASSLVCSELSILFLNTSQHMSLYGARDGEPSLC